MGSKLPHVWNSIFSIHKSWYMGDHQSKYGIESKYDWHEQKSSVLADIIIMEPSKAMDNGAG